MIVLFSYGTEGGGNDVFYAEMILFWRQVPAEELVREQIDPVMLSKGNQRNTWIMS